MTSDEMKYGPGPKVFLPDEELKPQPKSTPDLKMEQPSWVNSAATKQEKQQTDRFAHRKFMWITFGLMLLQAIMGLVSGDTDSFAAANFAVILVSLVLVFHPPTRAPARGILTAYGIIIFIIFAVSGILAAIASQGKI